MQRDMKSIGERRGRRWQRLPELRREAQLDSQKLRRALARRMCLRGVKAEMKWSVRGWKLGAWGMWVLRRALAARMRSVGEGAEI